MSAQLFHLRSGLPGTARLRATRHGLRRRILAKNSEAKGRGLSPAGKNGVAG